MLLLHAMCSKGKLTAVTPHDPLQETQKRIKKEKEKKETQAA